MIKTIIFDCGGVLIDEPLEDLIDYCANSLGVKAQSLKSVFSQYALKFQEGVILEKSLWKEVCDKLKVSEPNSKSLWKEAINSLSIDRKDIRQLVINLKKNGYKIALLSNMEIPAMEYFYENKYDKYFNVSMFSCVEKMSKPNSKIYHIALDKLQNKADEVVFIDDRLENIEGAEQVGMNGILFKNTDQLKKELAKLQVKIK